MTTYHFAPIFLLAAVATTILLSGCQYFAKGKLVGRWAAVTVLESGDSLQVDVSNVSFSLNRDGGLVYIGTLADTLLGTFRVRGELLIVRDTSKPGQAEFAIGIEHLSADTLVLKMIESGKVRYLKLARHP